LHANFPLQHEDTQFVESSRFAISEKLRGNVAGLVAIVGACAPKEEYSTMLNSDGLALLQAEQTNQGLEISQRFGLWKPRSNPKSWHGEETTNPIGAYGLMHEALQRRNKPSMEVAFKEHLRRYGQMLCIAWIGSRNFGNEDLLTSLALEDPSLPLPIKNGLDGDIDSALETVSMLNKSRSSIEGAAPVVLMYRGGNNAQTPEKWEKQYRRALQLTNGLMFVDVAHGAEMAHDPEGSFGKSAKGELLALEHVLQIAQDYGEMPAGTMAEASESPQVVDPHAPLELVISGIEELNRLKCLASNRGSVWRK
jgi:3-deoxy-D-arabino-heptulosonate 7-phosphate (DAHP) synthase